MESLRVRFGTRHLRSAGQVLLTPVFIFLPSRRCESDVPKLALLGAIVATFFLFTSAYLTPSSWSFLAFAYAIAHDTTLPALAGFAARDLGYPLLALLSGYTITGSIIPLTVIQAAFAIMIPILVYIPVARFSRVSAFCAGCITILSLTPYIFMKMIHHDETYMFFMMLMITLLLCYVQTLRLRYLYAFTVAAMAASLTRPAGNLLLPVLLTVSYAYERKRFLHYSACAMLLVSSIIFYKFERAEFFDLKAGEALPSYTGQQIFYGLYINSAEYGVTLSADVGPNMAEIGQAVRRYTAPIPSDVANIHNNVNFPRGSVFVKRRIDDLSPDELARQVLSVPCYQYHVLMGQAEPDDKIFLGAAAEIAETHPIYVARYAMRNLLIFLFRPGYAHPIESPDGNCGALSRIAMVFYPDYSRIFGNPPDIYVDQVMAREVAFVPPLRPRAVEVIYSAVRGFWLAYYNRLVDFVSVLVVTSWLIAITTLMVKFVPLKIQAAINSAGIVDNWLPSVIASSALLLYNGLVTAAFAEPDYRYSEMVFPLNILIAGLGASAVLRLCGIRCVKKYAPPKTPDLSRSPRILWVLACLAIIALMGSWSAYTIVQTHS